MTTVGMKTDNLRGLDEESQKMVVETVRQLRNKLLTKEQILEFDKKEIFPEIVIRELLSPEIGLQLLFIPEAYGGLGGGARDCCAITMEMARICLGVATAFFAIQLGADPLLVGGTEEQKQKWLGAISEGNSLVAYAVTEPNAGSNLASLKTKADPVFDAAGTITGYRINGSKQFISTGGYADFVTLLAITPEGPTFFVVEKGTKGFKQGKGEEKHGIRSSNTSPLTLEDVYVPVENLIGGVPGVGLKQANKVFGYTRLMVASMALGAAQSSLSIVIPYAKERIQFGTPLSEKQGYTHKLIVPHVVRMEAALAYIDEVAVLLDATDEDRQVEGSISKFFTTEISNKAADDFIQALGGYGYISEFEVEKIKRDVKITCIYEGTSEIQQNIISTFRWKIARKTKGAFYGKIEKEMLALSEKREDIGCRTYREAARILNQVIDFAHDNRLTKDQHIMFCLADMMTYVEVGVALARKTANLSNEDEAMFQKMQAISRVFSNDVAQMVSDRAKQIVLGSGVFNREDAKKNLDSFALDQLDEGRYYIIKDMDSIANYIFER